MSTTKKMFSQGTMLAIGATLLLAAVFVPDVAFAADGDSLGDMATNIKGETTQFGQLVVAIFALIGVALAGLGIVKLINAKKTNEPIGAAVGMIIGGALLTVILAVVGLTTQTTVQDTPSGIEDFGE